MTTKNILSAFRNTCTIPLQPKHFFFFLSDFLIGADTDRSFVEGNNECGTSNDQAILKKQNKSATDLVVNLCDSGTTTSKALGISISPDVFLGFHKAPERKNKTNKRKKRKSVIATDKPIKNETAQSMAESAENNLSLFLKREKYLKIWFHQTRA